MAYLDIIGIKKAFARHLMKYRGYDETEAAVAVMDYPDPYSNPYLIEEFEEDVEIDGVAYEMFSDQTDLECVGIDDVPPFCFFTYYRSDDVPNQLVSEYMKARKLYQLDDEDSETEE